MKRTKANCRLINAMTTFSDCVAELRTAINHYELDTHTDINDLQGFVEKYPFSKSLDETTAFEWSTAVITELRKPTYKVCRGQYVNTGGGTMVGIYDVWLPREKRMVYLLTNEEGCNMSVVDYISNELYDEDFDEFIIDCVDWNRMTGYEKYFELYRDCFNRYLIEDCAHYGTDRGVPYILLCDTLQEEITEDYRRWVEEENGGLFTTNGLHIVVEDDYTEFVEELNRALTTDDEELETNIHKVCAFDSWHKNFINYSDPLNATYSLSIEGRTVQIPLNADTWTAVRELLKAAKEV